MSADGVDLSAALSWASARIGPVVGVRELVGGQTSAMIALRTDSREVVLRLMTREPWRTHGAGLTTRERQVHQLLAPTVVPAPHSLALDAEGRHCGHPAHLMTLVPGLTDVDRVDDSSLAQLAEVLSGIHALPPTTSVRTYESWAWEAKYVVPSWAVDAGLWRDSFTLLRTPAPSYEPCFIHRDFALRNVLWSGAELSGVVDWVETSIGPAWLDVAHCCTNLALAHGSERADRFATAYVARTGREPEPYFDVMDIVGFLPPPGRGDLMGPEVDRQRLEDRLGVVMARLGG